MKKFMFCITVLFSTQSFSKVKISENMTEIEIAYTSELIDSCLENAAKVLDDENPSIAEYVCTLTDLPEKNYRVFNLLPGPPELVLGVTKKYCQLGSYINEEQNKLDLTVICTRRGASFDYVSSALKDFIKEQKPKNTFIYY